MSEQDNTNISEPYPAQAPRAVDAQTPAVESERKTQKRKHEDYDK